MPISNFKLPVGLEVSSSEGSQFTGSVYLSAGSKLEATASEISASAVSASVGRFGNLNVAGLTAPSLDLSENLTVDGYTILGDSSSDYAYISGTLTASAGAKVVNGLEVSASNLTVTGDISGSGKLELGGALTASAMSASGDVTVGGKLSVYGNLEVTGTLTYVNTENLVVTDKKVVIASGSDSANANNAGIYLGYDNGTEAAKLYYTHADTSWNTDRSLKATGDLSASAAVMAPVVTGSTTTGSFAKFTDITGSYISGINASFTTLSGVLSSSAIEVSDITGKYFGSHPTNTIVGLAAGGTGSVDTFSTASVGAAKYVLKARNIAGDVHTMEGLVTHDGTNAYFTSYASLYSNSPMIRLTASCAAGTVSVGAENVSAGNIAVGYLINYVY